MCIRDRPNGVTREELLKLVTATGTTSVIPGNEENAAFNAAFGITSGNNASGSNRVIDRTQIPPDKVESRVQKSKAKRPQVVQ